MVLDQINKLPWENIDFLTLAGQCTNRQLDRTPSLGGSSPPYALKHIRRQHRQELRAAPVNCYLRWLPPQIRKMHVLWINE